MIQDILDLMKDNSRTELRGFNITDRCVLADWPKKINCIVKHMRTENIADTNILIKAVIVYVGKKIGHKACGSKYEKELGPWWEIKIKKSINKVRKNVNILERHERRDEEERKIRRTSKEV